MRLTRREWMAAAGGAAVSGLRAAAPASPVSVARCNSYDEDLAAVLGKMFDQLGGLERLVKGKTVTVKLNLTGNPALRFEGRPPGVTHYTHPKVVLAATYLMGRAGARRIRLVEGAAETAAPLEEYLLDSGWNVRRLKNIAAGVEFENTNVLGKNKQYGRLKVPGGGLIYPAYDVSPAYLDTDVFVSMAKLKEHGTCGVTLSLKNCFGITPASIYGDDAGVEEPNENPTKGRVKIFHGGQREPSKSAPQELDSHSSRAPGYRVPHIVAELTAARPVDLAIIDGVESIAGGEGPWIPGIRYVRPGVLIAGRNAVCTDAVGTAVMRVEEKAFQHCSNTLLLAERMGVGTADRRRIEVLGDSGLLPRL
ncbi:MAG: DUF362 domain-containing protein [Bryobacterales bacterium]|nr:DUF362 domain-containing protein [Bryobacterales bacterium]